jgi:hypothetical protein
MKTFNLPALLALTLALGITANPIQLENSNTLAKRPFKCVTKGHGCTTTLFCCGSTACQGGVSYHPLSFLVTRILTSYISML